MIDIIIFTAAYFISIIVLIIIATKIDVRMYFNGKRRLVEDKVSTPSEIKWAYFWTNAVEVTLFTIGLFVGIILVEFGVVGL